MKFNDLSALTKELEKYPAIKLSRMESMLRKNISEIQYKRSNSDKSKLFFVYNINNESEKISFYDNNTTINSDLLNQIWDENKKIGRKIKSCEILLSKKSYNRLENEKNVDIIKEKKISINDVEKTLQKSLNQLGNTIVNMRGNKELEESESSYVNKFVFKEDMQNADNRIKNNLKTIDFILSEEGIKTSEDISQMLSKNMNSDLYTYKNMHNYENYCEEVSKDLNTKEIYKKIKNSMYINKLYISIINTYELETHFNHEEIEKLTYLQKKSYKKSKTSLQEELTKKTMVTYDLKEKILILEKETKNWIEFVTDDLEIMIKHEEIMNMEESSVWSPMKVCEDKDRNSIVFLNTEKLNGLNNKYHFKNLSEKFDIYKDNWVIKVEDSSEKSIKNYNSINEFWKEASSKKPWSTIEEINKSKPTFPYVRKKEMELEESAVTKIKEEKNKYNKSLSIWKTFKNLAFTKMEHKIFKITAKSATNR